MAKKGRYGDARTRNFEELNAILKNSFSGIKKDMNDIRENIHILQTYSEDTRGIFDASKKDFVTIDKLNALKIKLADMNEEVKRLDRIESVLKAINDRTIDKDRFESERQKSKETIDELKNQVSFAERLGKSALTEARLKQLSNEVSAEINEMVQRLDSYEKKGGKVVDDIAEKLRKEIEGKIANLDERFNTKAASLREEVGSETSQARVDVKSVLESERKESNRKMLKLLEGINKIRDENKKLITRNQVNDVLRSINKEFDALKEEIEDIKILRKDIKQIRKDKLNRAYFEQSMNDISKKVDSFGKDIAGLREELKYAKKAQKEMESAKNKAAAGKGRTGFFSVLMLANLLVVLAFILLGVSFTLYFFERTEFMNYVIVGAVLFFAAGIIIRIVSVIRE